MRILNLETGIEEEVLVVKIQSVNELKRLNKKTGWYINWSKMYKTSGVEVYAIRTIDGTIQGLVALFDDKDNKAIKIEWAVVAPHNNKLMALNGRKAYEGVGACLFAIAAHKSVELGYDGFIYGDAANQTVLAHYIKNFGAQFIPSNVDYRFYINHVEKLLEVYDK